MTHAARPKTPLWRRITSLTLALALTASAVTVATAVVSSTRDRASAATSASTFDAGNIISNDTFFNAAAMSAADVQTFLNARVAACRSGSTCLKGFSQATSSRAADSYCRAYAGASKETAAQIVAKVGVACGINTQVLLVMLQKEQGLVLSSAPSATAYRIAMGYGCPDTAACDSAYYGFANQVWNAAHQMQKYTKNSKLFSFQPGRNNLIQYNPSSSCGSKSVYIQNQATANLYIYTPYTPNQASLAAGYGSAPCGAYGNRNFYLYFSDWFGNPSNWLASGGFEGPSKTGWAFATGVNRASRTDATAQAGASYLVSNTPVASRTVSQTVSRATKIGEQANASIWLRSTSATPFVGTLALTGLGGTAETAKQTFSVGSTWTRVAVALPVRASTHTGVRLDVAMTTTGRNVSLDTATLGFTQAPVLQNTLVNPSFEGSFGRWTPGNGFLNQQIYNKPAQAKAGSWFAASNTAVAGRSFSQTVTPTVTAGDRWTAAVWLRSSSASKFTGRLALWGLGGSKNLNIVKSYSVGSTWTRVQVTLDVGAVVPTSLKIEVYLDTVASKGTLFLDGADLSKNLVSSGSFEGSAAGWNRSTTSGLNLAVYKAGGANTAVNGGSYAATNTAVKGASLTQDVALTPVVGDVYTAEIWVRRTGSAPFSGRLALWGLGAKTAGVSTAFTASGSWTLVSVSLPISASGVTSLRFQLYEDSTASTLAIDGAQLY